MSKKLSETLQELRRRRKVLFFTVRVEAEQLCKLPKGAPEKQVLAWCLRQRTTVGRRWVSERLGMGDESGVSRSIRAAKEGRDAELERIKKRLLKSAIEHRQNENELPG